MQNLFHPFHSAQQQAHQLLYDSFELLHDGMSSIQLKQDIKKRAMAHGFTGWVRPPFVRFSQPILRAGVVVQIHLQPSTEEAMASIGASQTYQQPNHPIIAQAKELCKAICIFASHRKCIGELFVFARSWANNNRTELVNEKNIGHRCFPPQGMLQNFWPGSLRLITMLRRHQVQWYNPRILQGIFAIHPFLQQDGLQAGFAEMIFIDGEKRILLGREDPMDLEQIGQ